jgi:hypothetical protein
VCDSHYNQDIESATDVCEEGKNWRESLVQLAGVAGDQRSLRALAPIQCKHYHEEFCCKNPMLFDDTARAWCANCYYPVHSTCLELCVGDKLFYCQDCLDEACEQAAARAVEALAAVQALRAAAAAARALEEGEAADMMMP